MRPNSSFKYANGEAVKMLTEAEKIRSLSVLSVCLCQHDRSTKAAQRAEIH